MLDAERDLRRWLPLHASAIGNPPTPTAYLHDVIAHNLACARFQATRTDRTNPRRMTNSQRQAFRAHLTYAKAARRILSTLSED